MKIDLRNGDHGIRGFYFVFEKVLKYWAFYYEFLSALIIMWSLLFLF